MSMLSVATTSTGAPTRIRPFLGTPTLVPEFVNGEFTGGVYKIEEKFFYNGELGLRIHAWIKPDPRIHNHPWEQIHCTILRGRYTALEYKLDVDNVLPYYMKEGEYFVCGVTLLPGEQHVVEHDTFHKVVDVIPGTVSLMRFTKEVPGGPGDWGHLINDGEGGLKYERAVNAPLVDGRGFLPAMQHLNPHLRPKDATWVDVYAEFPVPTIDEVLKSVGL